MSIFDEEPAIHYTFLIIDIHDLQKKYNANFKALHLNSSDIKECFWQIVENLSTHDDYVTMDRLSRLPDFRRLCAGERLLANDRLEALCKKTIYHLGLEVHEMVKSLGLYVQGIDQINGFNYILKDVTRDKMILRYLYS